MFPSKTVLPRYSLGAVELFSLMRLSYRALCALRSIVHFFRKLPGRNSGCKTVMEKRTLVTLTLKRKIDLINVAVGNPSKKRKEMAEEFGIAPTTVTGILKEKEKYKQQYFNGQTDVRKSRVRSAKLNAVDDALLKWFTHARSSKVPVTGPIMKARAEEISHQLGIFDWSCNEGWLHRFKKRYNISYKAICDERRAVYVSRHLTVPFTV